MTGVRNFSSAINNINLDLLEVIDEKKRKKKYSF